MPAISAAICFPASFRNCGPAVAVAENTIAPRSRRANHVFRIFIVMLRAVQSAWSWLFLAPLHAYVVLLFAGRSCVVCPACLLLIGTRFAAALRPRLGRSTADTNHNEDGSDG